MKKPAKAAGLIMSELDELTFSRADLACELFCCWLEVDDCHATLRFFGLFRLRRLLAIRII